MLQLATKPQSWLTTSFKLNICHQNITRNWNYNLTLLAKTKLCVMQWKLWLSRLRNICIRERVYLIDKRIYGIPTYLLNFLPNFKASNWLIAKHKRLGWFVFGYSLKDCLVSWLVHGLVDWVFRYVCLVGRLVSWLAGLMIGWLVGGLVGWLTTVWLVAWLVGWLV